MLHYENSMEAFCDLFSLLPHWSQNHKRQLLQLSPGKQVTDLQTCSESGMAWTWTWLFPNLQVAVQKDEENEFIFLEDSFMKKAPPKPKCFLCSSVEHFPTEKHFVKKSYPCTHMNLADFYNSVCMRTFIGHKGLSYCLISPS